MTRSVRLSDVNAFAKNLVAGFSDRELVLLKGPLGAGKTRLVKACVEALGGDAPDSPTFSVINEYAGAALPIYHIDLYRLDSDADIESTGFWDLFREPKGIIFVEWPEKVNAEDWPRSWHHRHVEVSFAKGADERLFSVS